MFETEEKMTAENAKKRGASETDENGVESEALPILEIEDVEQ